MANEKNSHTLKNLLKLLIFLVVSLNSGCSKDKTSPTHTAPRALINYDSDTNYFETNPSAEQQKILLMHEFTGVYCYTCPLAHGITAQALLDHPGKIAAVNVHSHYYSIYDDPNVMGNLYDFRTAENDTIVKMLGGVLSVPSASFNMKQMDGEDKIITPNRSLWNTYINSELQDASKINLEVAHKLVDNTLKIVLKITANEIINTPTYWSVALTENNIIDKQYVDTVIVENYAHMHILRSMVGNPRSELLANRLEYGEVIIKVFHLNLSETWNPAQMEIIPYISLGPSQWEVIQSAVQQVNT